MPGPCILLLGFLAGYLLVSSIQLSHDTHITDLSALWLVVNFFLRVLCAPSVSPGLGPMILATTRDQKFEGRVQNSSNTSIRCVSWRGTWHTSVLDCVAELLSRDAFRFGSTSGIVFDVCDTSFRVTDQIQASRSAFIVATK